MKEENQMNMQQGIVKPLESLSENFKGCKKCGNSEEAEGDFVVYQYSSVSHTTYNGSYKNTITKTNYFNIKSFIFRSCLDCTRTKIFTRLRLDKILSYVLLCIIVLGLTYGIYGLNTIPVNLNGDNSQRLPAAISFFIGILALVSIFPVLVDLVKYKSIFKGFPANRMKTSEAILNFFKKDVNILAQSLNSAAYRNGTTWKGNNFIVVTKHKWTTEIASKGTILTK
jgi:hypothetical protein